MKILKWLFISFFLLILTLALYLTLIFDPNDFKPQLVEEVKGQTGRELIIDNDLSWTFFPSLGIELSAISLSNPEGFDSAAMVEVQHIVAEVKLMPLFSREVEISQLNLDGLKLHIENHKDGRSSFDGLQGNKPSKEQAAPKETSTGAGLASLEIGGVAITNTQITLTDHKAGTEQVFTLDELHLGQFSLGEFASLDYKFSANTAEVNALSKGKGLIRIAPSMKQVELKDLSIENSIAGEGLPNNKLDVSFNAQVLVDLDAQQLSMNLEQLKAANIEASLGLKVEYGKKVPFVDLAVELGDIDLDTLMPKEENEASKSVNTDDKNRPVSEPDLSALQSVDMDLALTAKSIKVSNMLTENWQMDLVLKAGVLTLNKLNADLYDGKLLASATLDGKQATPSYRFKKSVTGVKIRQLLIDAADTDLLAGAANFTVEGKGRSLITENLKKNLAMKGQFEVADGALYGVNIPQMIRDAQAKLSGDLSAPASSEKKTDFTSLTGTFSMVNGVASNPDLLMASPLIRLSGAGTANIISEALDYKLSTSVVGSLEGQGGGERDMLYGVEIPFAITGTMSSPEFALDTAALFDAKLKQETDKVQDKLKDSILKKLGGF
ncbi:AsmA family protein [Shewanella sp. UCD-KL12]|uniref:AsmA family protein n=1 Tax=Shewanella sp. UCD-KL12 TaxID=1917163 RepID=UPI0009703EDB|nr:AsmA family protein [Shewanella sp. UCD-KL12]